MTELKQQELGLNDRVTESGEDIKTDIDSEANDPCSNIEYHRSLRFVLNVPGSQSRALAFSYNGDEIALEIEANGEVVDRIHIPNSELKSFCDFLEIFKSEI